MGIILFIVARLLQWLLTPLFFIYVLITRFNFKSLSDYFHKVAFGIDQLGNVMGGPIMNDFLLKKNPPLNYGNPDQTISYVTGINYKAGTLTFLGKFIAKILNFIDKDHVQKASNEQ